MSRTLNKVQLLGRLGGAVELKTTQSGKPVAQFSLATNSYSRSDNGAMVENDPDWHNIVAWDKLAETCHEYLGRGSQVYIEGRLHYRSYENKEGQKVYRTEIIASQMIMLDNPGARQQNGGNDEPVYDEDRQPLEDGDGPDEDMF